MSGINRNRQTRKVYNSDKYFRYNKFYDNTNPRSKSKKQSDSINGNRQEKFQKNFDNISIKNCNDKNSFTTPGVANNGRCKTDSSFSKKKRVHVYTTENKPLGKQQIRSEVSRIDFGNIKSSNFFSCIKNEGRLCSFDKDCEDYDDGYDDEQNQRIRKKLAEVRKAREKSCSIKKAINRIIDKNNILNNYHHIRTRGGNFSLESTTKYIRAGMPSISYERDSSQKEKNTNGSCQDVYINVLIDEGIGNNPTTDNTDTINNINNQNLSDKKYKGNMAMSNLKSNYEGARSNLLLGTTTTDTNNKKDNDDGNKNWRDFLQRNKVNHYSNNRLYSKRSNYNDCANNYQNRENNKETKKQKKNYKDINRILSSFNKNEINISSLKGRLNNFKNSSQKPVSLYDQNQLNNGLNFKGELIDDTNNNDKQDQYYDEDKNGSGYLNDEELNLFNQNLNSASVLAKPHQNSKANSSPNTALKKNKIQSLRTEISREGSIKKEFTTKLFTEKSSINYNIYNKAKQHFGKINKSQQPVRNLVQKKLVTAETGHLSNGTPSNLGYFEEGEEICLTTKNNEEFHDNKTNSKKKFIGNQNEEKFFNMLCDYLNYFETENKEPINTNRKTSHTEKNDAKINFMEQEIKPVNKMISNSETCPQLFNLIKKSGDATSENHEKPLQKNQKRRCDSNKQILLYPNLKNRTRSNCKDDEKPKTTAQNKPRSQIHGGHIQTQSSCNSTLINNYNYPVYESSHHHQIYGSKTQKKQQQRNNPNLNIVKNVYENNFIAGKLVNKNYNKSIDNADKLPYNTDKPVDGHNKKELLKKNHKYSNHTSMKGQAAYDINTPINNEFATLINTNENRSLANGIHEKSQELIEEELSINYNENNMSNSKNIRQIKQLKSKFKDQKSYTDNQKKKNCILLKKYINLKTLLSKTNQILAMEKIQNQSSQLALKKLLVMNFSEEDQNVLKKILDKNISQFDKNDSQILQRLSSDPSHNPNYDTRLLIDNYKKKSPVTDKNRLDSCHDDYYAFENSVDMIEDEHYLNSLKNSVKRSYSGYIIGQNTSSKIFNSSVKDLKYNQNTNNKKSSKGKLHTNDCLETYADILFSDNASQLEFLQNKGNLHTKSPQLITESSCKIIINNLNDEAYESISQENFDNQFVPAPIENFHEDLHNKKPSLNEQYVYSQESQNGTRKDLDSGKGTLSNIYNFQQQNINDTDKAHIKIENDYNGNYGNLVENIMKFKKNLTTDSDNNDSG